MVFGGQNFHCPGSKPVRFHEDFYLPPDGTKAGMPAGFASRQRMEPSGARMTIKKRSGDIFCAVPFEGEQLLDTIAVVALQLNGAALDGSPAGEFSFQEFLKIVKIDVGWIKALDNGNFFPVPAFVDFDPPPSSRGRRSAGRNPRWP